MLNISKMTDHRAKQIKRLAFEFRSCYCLSMPVFELSLESFWCTLQEFPMLKFSQFPQFSSNFNYAVWKV